MSVIARFRNFANKRAVTNEDFLVDAARAAAADKDFNFERVNLALAEMQQSRQDFDELVEVMREREKLLRKVEQEPAAKNRLAKALPLSR